MSKRQWNNDDVLFAWFLALMSCFLVGMSVVTIISGVKCP